MVISSGAAPKKTRSGGSGASTLVSTAARVAAGSPGAQTREPRLASRMAAYAGFGAPRCATPARPAAAPARPCCCHDRGWPAGAG
ncbi:MAG: hypothetical protein ACLQDY_18290 [Streptosporangiaceae bacterium]